ncbi:MAG: thymidine phosphorylase [Clostridia bacterium]|nr:thymidine phosphorylase [Clostridia bacterium]
MTAYELILKKRNGGELSKEEIESFVSKVVSGGIDDAQTAAFLMAVYFRGMTDRETAYLTDAMTRSGDTVDLSAFGSLSADKHSTGGVGDKTSLIVAPVAACLGLKIAKMSGRGLGHTGGTVDKLESIPGFRTSLSPEEFISQTEKTGIALIGATGNLAPADKKLYALRDVIAAVDSIPLIVSSIMSKKLAAGAKNIVLDVKTGSGAFMKTAEDACLLAEKMVSIGKACGRNIAAVITDMNKPLGHNVGNALEVVEAVNVLRGEKTGDLREVCLALASNMVALAKNMPISEAEKLCAEALDSGKAFIKMKEWIGAQGGDVRYLDNVSLFPETSIKYEVLSPRSGYISGMDAEKIGLVSVLLGAGREKKDDVIDPAAGLVLCKKTGEYVERGEALCTLYTNKTGIVRQAEKEYLDSLVFSDLRPEEIPLIIKTVV